MKTQQIDKIFSIWAAENPHPATELNYINNYTLLVAVVLSAQSTDVGVNKATKALFKIADTPQKMLKLGEENLKKYIATIGLYNAKASNIIKLSQRLVDDFNSEVPNNFAKLKSLPGVGQKTANVVLNCAFGQPTIAVDTHVFRVANRIGFVDENTPEKTEIALLKIIPRKWQQHAHHWLILHGRYICKARKPECKKCKIEKFCNFKEKTQP
ncbi:MAG: endonuclease III [Alphaproteobacteria bacterium RIFCSPLOWO2_01_FULL_40_26]|nr:MAG: endonuclease III [Alphaproteobacteria bacterium RIFCSPHIGHO2_02_FULL_40_34]OFW94003.1 MAG: endonuclease III [Alphaproteobacteria bacterium RIFCSPLOWO2_01_FULL_40_26]OFX09538.1 MAG: endonuclease III [Alphaproteobacteria bacterium RIFCSPLOWO2_02_FULL_40_19]OFX10986.1 MAG: endonuclease III [Alphaproteobacteria bacterium RIFCSPLOWO2_12_FULL_40_11]